MPDESFYTLHDDFEPDAPGGMRLRVEPSLVRSIEAWCCQRIEPIEPIELAFITDRVRVRQHFNRWLLQVQMVHGLDRASLVESCGCYLFDRLRQYPEDPTIRLHWMAFFMHRSVIVGWRIWRSIPPQLRSFTLFQEIIRSSHCQIANFSQGQPILATFKPTSSQFVSGLGHITTYIDRQIKYSLRPYVGKEIGDPNFGLSNLGVASGYSPTKIYKALTQISIATIDIEEYIKIRKCLAIYQQDTKIKVNRLSNDDFAKIEQQYRQISPDRSSEFLDATNIKTRLEEIGVAVRKVMLCQPLAIDAPINEFQARVDTIPSNRQDLLECQIAQERWEVIKHETEALCETANLPARIPSHQQMIWLYYGVDLTQTCIGRLLADNFNLNPSPGSVSLRLRDAREHLFRSIHTSLKNPIPALTHQEIAGSIGTFLEEHFDTKIYYYVRNCAAELDLRLYCQLSTHQQAELVDRLTNWFNPKLAMRIPPDLLETAMLRILRRFFDLS